MAAVWEEGEYGGQKGNQWKAWASEQHAKGCCLFCGDPTHPCDAPPSPAQQAPCDLSCR